MSEMPDKEELKVELEYRFHVNLFNAFCRALEIDGNAPESISSTLMLPLELVLNALAEKAKLPTPEEFLENRRVGPLKECDPFSSMSKESLDKYIRMLDEINIAILSSNEKKIDFKRQRTLSQVCI